MAATTIELSHFVESQLNPIDSSDKHPPNGRGPVIINGIESDTEMGDSGIAVDAKDMSKSRFKVAKVDFAVTVAVDTDEIAKHDDHTNSNSKTRSPLINLFHQTSRERKDSQRSEKNSVDSPTLSSSPTNTYADTHYLKTFGQNTHEALPHADHYRNLLSTSGPVGAKPRPTLDELHEERDEGEFKFRLPLIGERGFTGGGEPGNLDHKKTSGAVRFGWIKGVLVRCLLNIWGVMLFLRLSWVVGQAGIGMSTLIVLLSAVVTSLTAISMSAICTNGEVKGGGAYFMISRSLGPEFGGAIGLIFSVANAVAVAMYVVGFAETVQDLMEAHDAVMTDEINDIRIIGVITISLLLMIAIVGMEWEARAQLILLAILIVALINFTIGSFLVPGKQEQAKGFVGYKGEVFEENFFPNFRDEGFFSVFSVFFPAATGILAGANISGDLKDAQDAIPKGTLTAILISSIVYIVVAWQLGGCLLREASGVVLMNSVALNTSAASSVVDYTVADAITSARNCSLVPGNECKYGLMNDYQTMELASGFAPLIVAGIFSATLSSALASLLSAPKVFQAVCKDHIFPGIHIFAKGYGRNNDPRRAYFLAFFIGIAFIFIGELNAIAPIISNFFLMSYALINYSCFDASLARSPGWRPAFKYYSMWISLLGATVCLVVMFIINWWTALITFAVVAALYVYVHYSKPDVNWGSSTQAHVYRNALQSTLKLVSIDEHVKNFRPQVLVLTGLPSNRPALLDFVSNITKNISIMICGHILMGKQGENLKVLRSSSKFVYNWLHKRKVKSFYNIISSPNFRLGVQNLMQSTGIGKLRPNTLILGYKNNWQTDDPQAVSDYFNIIHDAFDLHYAVGIMRVKGGFDCKVSVEEAMQHMVTTAEDEIMYDEPTPIGTPTIERKNLSSIQRHDPFPVHDTSRDATQCDIDIIIEEPPEQPLNDNINKELLKTMNRFQRKQKKGTIDVWWMFDDGGLTLLIPYLLSTKSNWSGCKLRVFTAGTKKGELDRETRQMVTLLNKFRIDATDMIVIPDVGKNPKEESKREFETMMQSWIVDKEKGETKETHPWKTTKEEIDMLRDKTKRHMRLRELLQQHSADSSLIVMTLPMPRKGTCSTGLYMAWIELLTKDMPPILLLRGNQTSVLTYYS